MYSDTYKVSVFSLDKPIVKLLCSASIKHLWQSKIFVVATDNEIFLLPVDRIHFNRQFLFIEN